MEEFNKKLKVDRVNQFGHLVKAMAHGTPTEGYTIREASADTCAGCAFYSITSEGKPECKGISLPCDGDYRGGDGKNVVYEPLKTGEPC